MTGRNRGREGGEEKAKKVHGGAPRRYFGFLVKTSICTEVTHQGMPALALDRDPYICRIMSPDAS
jgi:hypothetical protein